MPYLHMYIIYLELWEVYFNWHWRSEEYKAPGFSIGRPSVFTLNCKCKFCSRNYWKCNFPMNTWIQVCWLVGVGVSTNNGKLGLTHICGKRLCKGEMHMRLKTYAKISRKCRLLFSNYRFFAFAAFWSFQLHYSEYSHMGPQNRKCG